MKMQGRKKCQAPGCRNYRDNMNNKAVFIFPKDPVRCRVWIQNCGNPNLLSLPVETLSRRCFLCPEHFEPQYFWNKFRRRLHRNAVPTIFSGRGLTDEEMARYDGLACVNKDMAEQDPTRNLIGNGHPLLGLLKLTLEINQERLPSPAEDFIELLT